MTKTFIVILIMMVFSATGQDKPVKKDYPIRPVPFTAVHFTDDFWKPRLDTNRLVTIPYDFKKSEVTGRISNFARAGGLEKGSFVGIRYNDSDVYKIIEGAAYSLAVYPDSAMEHYLDSLINLITAAQEDDGYLYTCRTINPDTLPPYTGKERWSQLKDSHELYNIGHMYEAAVAYYEATGKKTLLDVAIKSADLVCKTFGPGKDQLHGVPGHQEIEIGLVKLYRVTGDERYLKMAKYFLDQRGNARGHTLYVYGPDGSNKTYTQDHKPVTQQTEAVGHAVRAGYMYSAMADIAALTGDTIYKKAVERLWKNVVYKKTYITGGIGSVPAVEGFGEDYDLPNLTAYCETCAAVANMLWNQRMFLLNGESKYIDVLEKTLYNGFLSGVSVHGDEFFYPNPLESDGSHQRQPWFNCSCCPTNVVRFMPSIPGYVYATRKDRLYVNLFVGNRAEIDMDFGKVNVIQKTAYPFDGKVSIEINPEKEKKFTVSVRIPGWLSNPLPGDLYSYVDKKKDNFVLTINGKPAEYNVKDGYINLDRKWKKEDVIELEFPMRVRKVLANPKVEADRGKFAIERGPLVYCAEWVDNHGKARNLLMDTNSRFMVEYKKDLVGGVDVIKGEALALSENSKDEIVKKKQLFTAIPYYAWAHRGAGEMAVWLPYEESAASPVPPSTIASESKVSASYFHDVLTAVNDQVIPKSSNDEDIPRMTFWSHKGTTEWVQYDFKQPTLVSFVHVYWFDDGPDGGCRVPETWRLLYRGDGEWKEVFKHGDYPVEKDKFNTLEISPVKTDALRMEIKLQKGFSGGILEWKVE